MKYNDLSKEEKNLIKKYRAERRKYPKRWRYGVEMPEFSGRSWKELQDLWPPEMRTSSEAYYILVAFQPAWEKIKFFTAQLLNMTVNKADLKFHDIGLLAWCSRCEELKEGLMADSAAVRQALMLGDNKRVFFTRKAILTKYGLIENIPAGPEYDLPTFYCYRLTEKGRIVLKKFVEFVDEAHEILKIVNVTAKETPADKIDQWIEKNTLIN
jgi:hypothetical protein